MKVESFSIVRAFPLFLVKKSIVLVLRAGHDYDHAPFDNFGCTSRSWLGSNSFFLYTYFQDDPKCSLIIWYKSFNSWNKVLFILYVFFLLMWFLLCLFFPFCLTLYYCFIFLCSLYFSCYLSLCLILNFTLLIFYLFFLLFLLIT